MARQGPLAHRDAVGAVEAAGGSTRAPIHPAPSLPARPPSPLSSRLAAGRRRPYGRRPPTGRPQEAAAMALAPQQARQARQGPMSALRPSSIPSIPAMQARRAAGHRQQRPAVEAAVVVQQARMPWVVRAALPRPALTAWAAAAAITARPAMR